MAGLGGAAAAKRAARPAQWEGSAEFGGRRGDTLCLQVIQGWGSQHTACEKADGKWFCPGFLDMCFDGDGL